jgi:predicted transcriptional regulator
LEFPNKKQNMGMDQNDSHTAAEPTTTAAGRISELGPVIDLLKKPQMAMLYTAAQNTVVTVPDLLEEVDITKSTAYEYVAALQRAGLMSEVETGGPAAQYTAHEFIFRLEVDGMVVKITPEVVEVLSEQHINPEIQGFVEQYGLATLAAFIDLANEHADGGVTTRMIADILDIPRGRAYDMLDDVGRILELGDCPVTEHAADVDEGERDELLDR